MVRVGLIDNLGAIDEFRTWRFHLSTAAELMRATGGNTGNVAFAHATRLLLAGAQEHLDWGQVAGAAVDQLVVCCANQIGKHADLGGWADILEAAEKPVTLIGLGAQAENYDQRPSVPEGTLRFLEVVKALRPDPSVPNIGVRGCYTQSVLAELGTGSVVTGCPSLLISPERLLGRVMASRAVPAKPLIAVAAGNPWHGPSAFLEPVLVDVVERYHGLYVLQHPESMIQFAFGERENITDVTRRRFLEVYHGRFDFDELLGWYRHRSAVFADVPNWIRSLQRFDLVIGPRYHGVALGVQAGVPGTVFAIDSRTQELCDEAGIKCLHVAQLKGMSAADLVEASRWQADDFAHFDVQRASKASAVRDFFVANRLQPSAHLVSLAQ